MRRSLPSAEKSDSLLFVAALCVACGGSGGGPDATLDAGLDAASPATDATGVDVPRDRVRVVAADWPRTPPPFPAYSHGTCPTLVSGPTSSTALNAHFPSGAFDRSFRLVVPRNYDPQGTDAWPLLIAWHWLAGNSDQMVHEGEIEASAERYRMIVAVPEQLWVNGHPANGFTWPFLRTEYTDPELVFTDDLLACIPRALRIDPTHVHALGVSAGALWVTALASTARAQHFASVAILSGGLAQAQDFLRMQYVPQPNKYPALVLWGGPTDRFLIDFATASQLLRDALWDDGHFLVSCTHDRGHALPPLVPPGPGESRFAFVWSFFAAHPYGLPPATSPWNDAGLPPSAPSWCSVVMQ